MLEREEERSELGAAIAAAARREGSSLLIRGPAGIGKTALQRFARQRAGDAGFRVLFARGGDLERDLPWAVVRELYAAPLHEAGESERRALLSGAAAFAKPVVHEADPEPIESVSGPAADALGAAVHGLYWLTSNLAEHRPLLLAVDDLHLADPPSLRFLGYLAQRVGDLPALLVATARPAEPRSEARLPAGFGDPDRLLEPAPLSERGAQELLSRDRGREHAPEFARACHEVTAGNPHLLHELARELRREGIDPTAEHAPRVRELTPIGISRAVLLRLARFPESAVRLAEAVAVLGTGATLADSAALAGLAPDAAASAATELATADVLAPGLPLGFAHPIVRDVVYDEIAAARRVQLHAQAARVLTEKRAPAEEVAVHLLHTEPGTDPIAVETLRTAARGSLARGVPESAIGYLRRALAESLDPDPRAGVLIELAEAEAVTGSATALERLEQALEIARSPRERAEILFKLGWMLFNAGQPGEAAAAFERGSSELGDVEDDLAAGLRTARIGMGTLVGEVEAGELESLLRDAAGPGTARTRAAEREVLTQLAFARVLTAEDSEGARSLAERALGDGAMLRESGVSLTFSLAAGCLIWSDALEPAEREIEMALERLRERGDLLGTAYVRFGRFWVCYWTGRVGEAAADAETAARAWSGGGQLAGQLPLARHWHAISLLELDQPRAAQEALGDEDERWVEHYRLSWRAGRARVALALGDAAAARDDLRGIEAAAATIPFFHTPATYAWRSDAAIAAARLGDADDARRLATENLELARRFGAARTIGTGLRAAGMVEGGQRAIELLDESVSVLERSPSRLELCRSLVDLGSALRRAGTPARAREPLRRGLEMAHRLGALALARRAREELAATGARPRRAELSGPESLTHGERRVCKLAADGLTNREIAEQLFVSLRTVETHLTHAYGKLDISSRRELGQALAGAP